MEKLDKLNRLKTAIKTGNPELIDHAFEEIKTKGDHSYIAPLVQLLHTSSTKEIKELVYQLFSDLKNEHSVDQLIDELKKEQDPEVLARLVSTCWQNGLNYSQHLPYFVGLIIGQEFQIAFEAFTVIENMYGKIDPDIENSLVGEIERSIGHTEERKQYLLRGLLEIIPNIPLDQDPVDY